jgi:hypothetical protein
VPSSKIRTGSFSTGSYFVVGVTKCHGISDWSLDGMPSSTTAIRFIWAYGDGVAYSQVSLTMARTTDL